VTASGVAEPSIPRVSIVVPVYNEGDLVVPMLVRILDSVTMPCEVLAVYDSEEDTTRPHLEEMARSDPRLISTHNTFGRGPAQALRYGFAKASAPVVVVTMADGSDDPTQIEPLVRLVERGVVVAAASRYMHGGQQVGAPFPKRLLSRAAGLSLYWFARVGTHDATNSFKAYDRTFVEEVGIESAHGFEIGIELVAKARRRRLPVAELPTIWLERQVGASNFQLRAWVPRYLRWYRYAFGPKGS
jgi:cellulose synthase/poly-beta-1,6-N-acetylglucosamine synthase-like glycosyltransferase